MGNNGGPGNNRFSPFMLFALFCLLALLITTIIYGTNSGKTSEQISYTEFYKLVSEDQVKAIEINGDRINITLKDDSTYKGDGKAEEARDYVYRTTGQNLKVTYYTAYVNDEDLIPLLKEHNVEIKAKLSDSTASIIYSILSFVVPLVIFWALFVFMMRRMGGGSGGGIFGVGKSNAKVYVEKKTGVTFKDVAGQDEAKESLQEVVDFLHNPQKYTAIGAKLPKGALLVGPPGTGKTLLAKAVAGEAGVPFFSLAGSDFVEMFVGVGASRVRDLFRDAEKMAPSIIFIDEIDAIGKSRASRFGGGNDEREQTLNALLAEMDGFDTSKGLLVIAATNRPEILDKALLRPGRFDRRIIVDRPDLKGREETLKVHSKDVPLDETVDLHALALASAGLVGSDLANIINEAAIIAVKAGRKTVNQDDLFEAFELVAVGGKEKKDRAMSEEERKTVSYHEVGHALVSALQKNAEPVQKITIVPRTMGALGYTLQTPEEEKFLETKEELLAKIVTYMGGRAAEEIVFGTITSGAANDIENATAIARNMVTRFGMSDKFGMMGLATVESQYLDGRASLNCGEKTASKIDAEVLSMINKAYHDAKEMLIENREVLDEISEYLYEKETITGKEFMKMYRKLKGIPEPEEDEEESDKKKKKKDKDKDKKDKDKSKDKKEKSDGSGDEQPKPVIDIRVGDDD
ncbi:MAG: ATP-dependent zinc metalloprotease FtsH [Lachnospiraceae bacterium]|nr:ATP-dependent zinc metalloprotease FtsH [Lachnospiraceae bacterium]